MRRVKKKRWKTKHTITNNEEKIYAKKSRNITEKEKSLEKKNTETYGKVLTKTLRNFDYSIL